MNVDTRTVLQKAQDFAIWQALSEWNNDMDYEVIIKVLRSDEYTDGDDDVRDSVIPWEVYEDWEGCDIADMMQGMVQDLVALFGDK